MLENVAEDNEPKLPRYRDWLNEATEVALKKDDTFKVIDDDRIFFCSFEEGGETKKKATTQYELIEWVKQMVPEKASLEQNKKASVANIAVSM